jgi:hypothetical protein
MRLLIGARFDVHPLPLAATTDDSPVDGYVRMAGRPVFHTDSERLLAFMLGGAGPDD